MASVESAAKNEEIALFIKNQGYSSDVIQKVKDSRVDGSTLELFKKTDFLEMGIALADYYKINSKFIAPSTGDVGRLRELLATARSRNPTSIVSASKRAKPTSVTISMCWYNFNKEKRKYTQVRELQGGGKRTKVVSRQSTLEDIKEHAKDTFFSSGKSRTGKQLSDYSFCLGDYALVEIQDETMTVQKYADENFLKSLRFNLLTRMFTSFQKMINIHCFSDDESSDVSESPKILKMKNHKQVHSISDDEEMSLPPFTSTPLAESIKDGLVGTSAERENLRTEMENGFLNSLQADQEKDQEKLLQQERCKKLTDQMKERKSRVTPEAGIDEDHCVVTVRHPSLGSKVRLFKAGCQMLHVYDWIGSLSPEPEHFELQDFSSNTIYPIVDVFSAVLKVKEIESPMVMSKDGEVAFFDYRVAEYTQPKEDSESNSISPEEHFDSLQHAQDEEMKKMSYGNLVEAVVSREHIFEDILQLYKKRTTVNSHVTITFVGEDAKGEGVSRDAYSAFFESWYRKMDGESEKIPSNSNMEDEDLEVIGKIITHSFLMHSIFPVQLSKSSLKKTLLGSVTDGEMLESFLQFLPAKETELIHQFAKDCNRALQPIQDVLFEYGIFETPNQSNVYALMTKAANVALVRQPCFPMQNIIKGMGSFWNKVTGEMLDSIYICTIPNAEKLISNIVTDEKSQQESRIITWIHRYIRSCTNAELLLLLRFITGSTSFLPNTIIKVMFVNQPIKYLRPTSQTCFKIFHVPRQYSSFTQLKENLNFYIKNPENWSVSDKTIG